MHRIFGIIVLTGIVLVGVAHGSILFEDNFASHDEWVGLFGTCDETVTDGNYIMDNKESGICVKKHSADFANFSYTVSFTPLKNTIRTTGVMFCWNDSHGGYEFSIDSLQRYTLSKFEPGSNGMYGSVVLAMEYNSFINPSDENIITVSKDGSEISLVCNDVLLTRYTDSSFERGDIGLVVSGGNKVSFDYVRVTDQSTSASIGENFTDNFDDGDMIGWRQLTAAGTVENTGTALRLTGGNSSQTVMYTNGKFRNSPVRVIVKKESGQDNSFYGLALLSIRLMPTADDRYEVKHDGVYFTISGNRYYGVYKNQTTFYPAASSHIHGTTDTLSVTEDYLFVVNGDTLPNTDLGDDIDFNAVALVCGPNVTVSFDEFVAGNQNSSPVVNHFRDGYAPSTPRFAPKRGYGIVFDPRGRVVARVSMDNHDRGMGNLGAGSFFILHQAHGTALSSKKATILK